MKHQNYIYTLPDSNWIQKLCRWADIHFEYFAFQNGNKYEYPEQPFETRFFAGERILETDEIFHNNSLFTKVGVIGYDYKNQIEKLTSKNPAFFTLPDLCFFEANLMLSFVENEIHSNQELTQEFWTDVSQVTIPINPTVTCEINPQICKSEYLEAISEIRKHLIEGNTYECNFCQAYSGEFEHWDPVSAYFKLNRKSPMPFSALFKAKDKWLLSASPERYLKRKDAKIIAQPIKGTIRRGKTEKEDFHNSSLLAQSEKEQAENLMITDLMRNDLSKVALTGTVTVDELFGIYPMPMVFQMISTISATLQENITFEDIINASFPMGSMTGAPKIKTMEIIDQLEKFQRGWFSGTFGVIEENGNFDFSVIIRSIIADSSAKKLFVGVGSAITYDADAAQEYEECLLKAKAIQEVLRGK